MLGILYIILMAAVLILVLLKPPRRPAARAGEPARAVVCPHLNAVDVDSVVTGEILARWCPDCDTQLEPRRRDVITQAAMKEADDAFSQISAARKTRQAELDRISSAASRLRKSGWGPPPADWIARRNELVKELEAINAIIRDLGKYGHQPLLLTRQRHFQIWQELKEITEKLEKAGETDENLRELPHLARPGSRHRAGRPRDHRRLRARGRSRPHGSRPHGRIPDHLVRGLVLAAEEDAVMHVNFACLVWRWPFRKHVHHWHRPKADIVNCREAAALAGEIDGKDHPA